jgi:hypothetical protein
MITMGFDLSKVCGSELQVPLTCIDVTVSCYSCHNIICNNPFCSVSAIFKADKISIFFHEHVHVTPKSPNDKMSCLWHQYNICE